MLLQERWGKHVRHSSKCSAKGKQAVRGTADGEWVGLDEMGGTEEEGMTRKDYTALLAPPRYPVGFILGSFISSPFSFPLLCIHSLRARWMERACTGRSSGIDLHVHFSAG